MWKVKKNEKVQHDGFVKYDETQLIKIKGYKVKLGKNIKA